MKYHACYVWNKSTSILRNFETALKIFPTGAVVSVRAEIENPHFIHRFYNVSMTLMNEVCNTTKRAIGGDKKNLRESIVVGPKQKPLA